MGDDWSGYIIIGGPLLIGNPHGFLPAESDFLIRVCVILVGDEGVTEFGFLDIGIVLPRQVCRVIIFLGRAKELAYYWWGCCTDSGDTAIQRASTCLVF